MCLREENAPPIFSSFFWFHLYIRCFCSIATTLGSFTASSLTLLTPFSFFLHYSANCYRMDNVAFRTNGASVVLSNPISTKSLLWVPYLMHTQLGAGLGKGLLIDWPFVLLMGFCFCFSSLKEVLQLKSMLKWPSCSFNDPVIYLTYSGLLIVLCLHTALADFGLFRAFAFCLGCSSSTLCVYYYYFYLFFGVVFPY